ncbi:MAG: serine/threonine-protein kinase [Bacteroidia bacterium]
MTPDRWQQIKSLFHQALERPQKEHVAFLQTACGGDTAMFEEVIDLLSHYQPEETFFEEWQQQQVSAMLEWGEAPLLPGDQLDNYHVQEEIGRGGMAIVYLAERIGDGFSQKVAIKVMKRGVDTDHVVSRFHQERKLLASIQHPHIARMIDGGSTPMGLPYFVMEYIGGEPLIDYINRVNPSIQDRIRLFMSILDAVAYAHGRLILHRDLKPANILVDDRGEIKLLDFGIARLLDEDAQHLTQDGQQWLTPAYASPEQMEGLPLGTASDLYQLGLVLYEMITSRRPYHLEGKDRHQQQEIIQTTAPASHEQLQGDLAAIVFMALRKEPERRYASVSAMADDLNRWMENRPVLAQPDSWSYRTSRYFRRNRRTIIAAAMIVLSLTSGLGIALWQARQARIARDRAEATLSWLVGFFDSPNPFHQQDLGPDLSVREFLSTAIPGIEKDLAGQPIVQADLYAAAAKMYAGLTIYDSAYSLNQKAIKYYPEGSPEQISMIFQMAQNTTTAHLADSLYLEALRLALETRDRDFTPAQVWQSWGYSLVTRGEMVMADSVLSLAIKDFTAHQQERTEPYLIALHARAMARRDLGAYGEADSLMGIATILAREVYPATHPYHAILLNSRAVVARYQQKTDTAEAWLRQALVMQEKILPPTHDEILSTLHNLALVLGDNGKFAEEEEIYRKNLQLKAQKYGTDSYMYANTLQNLSLSLKRQNRLGEASDSLLRTYEIYRKTLPGSNPRAAYPLITLCLVQYDQGNYQASVNTATQARDYLQNSLPDGHPVLADIALFLGRSLVKVGKLSSAKDLLMEAVGAYSKDGSAKYNLPMARSALAELYQLEGRPDLAKEWE